MTGVMSLLQAAAKFSAIEHELKETEHLILARACQIVCDRAKESLGEYQFGWVSLKPETIAHKIRGDSPLLETGELRDSITWSVSENVGHVGSNNDKAVWHELGTSRIPPRPFLVPALLGSRHEIEKMAAKAVLAVLRGGGHAEIMELIHLLKHVAHQAKEAFNAMTEDNDGGRHR